MYAFDLKQLREWCEEHLDTLGHNFGYTKNYRKNGSIFHTDNRYFDLKTLEKLPFCLQVYENFSEHIA